MATGEKLTLSLRTKSGRGLPQSKTLRESEGAGKSASSWSAPVLWRFGSGLEMATGEKLTLGWVYEFEGVESAVPAGCCST